MRKNSINFRGSKSFLFLEIVYILIRKLVVSYSHSTLKICYCGILSNHCQVKLKEEFCLNNNCTFNSFLFVYHFTYYIISTSTLLKLNTHFFDSYSAFFKKNIQLLIFWNLKIYINIQYISGTLRLYYAYFMWIDSFTTTNNL